MIDQKFVGTTSNFCNVLKAQSIFKKIDLIVSMSFIKSAESSKGCHNFFDYDNISC